MPTNRTRRTRKFIPTVSEEVLRYLKSGEYEGGDFEVFMLTGQGGREELRDLWESCRDEIMPDWIKEYPGTRPWGWWEFEAPCEPVEGAEYKSCAQRKRIGGTGTPSHEVLNVWGGFSFGIPRSWVSKFDEEYYNGRKKDIHGKPIGTEYKEGNFKGKAIDRDDPPRYESEAAYLDRHGLLTETEKKYLVKHSKLLEPERVEFDNKE